MPLLPTPSFGPYASTCLRAGSSSSTIRCVQCASVALGERIGADELGREARDAEGEAGGPLHPARIADHDLEASAAEVEAHRRRGVEHDGRAYRAEDQPRFLVPTDDVHGHSRLLPDAVHELRAVLGPADRARRLGQCLGRVGGVAQHAETANRGDGLVGGGPGDVPVAAHHVAEAEHLLLAYEGIEVAVGVHVGDEQVEGVRPEVHGCHAHEDEGNGRYGGVMNGGAPSATQFRAMGTDVTVLVLDGPADTGDLAAAAIERLEEKWSRFRPTSELCALNAAAGAPVVVSDETFALVDRAVLAWRSTAGLYDPTVLPAVVAAGYDRDFDAVVAAGAGPPADADSAPAPGCASIELDAQVRAIALPAGVALDLGGIGKGYAADLVARELVDAGALGVLVNLGGDLRALGAAPEPHGWVIDVDDPLHTGVTGMLALREGAVATSTRLRRTWVRDGRSLHHLIDPRTGLPAATGLASVTVVAGDAWRAEVLAKAAFIAGPVDGGAVIVDAGATGLLVTDDGRVDDLAGLAEYRV